MLLHGRALDAPFLEERDGDVRVGDFLGRAVAASAQMAGAAAIVNLCEQRLNFLVALVGALQAGVPTLMPSSRAPEAVAAASAAYPGAIAYCDEDAPLLAPSSHGAHFDVHPMLLADQPALVGFTSGSTGAPSAHRKFWPSLIVGTAHNAARIRQSIPAEYADRLPWIIGTVPPQHMYGMELTVLVPLLAGFGLHGGRPLLPAEVAAAMAEVPEPRVLVSTPAHLRAIVNSGAVLPHAQVIVSATAPLDAALAATVETAMGGTVVEMFGATETCILGARETARETTWRCYDGVRFLPTHDGTSVHAPWFRAPQKLLDVIEQDPDGGFRLLGRSLDLIDVAGKRASLADLTQRLLAIDGVQDGVFIQPDGGDGLVRRLAAFVVAPGLSTADVRSQLERAVDPVFSPRPLVFVDALPRNATGKLPRQALLALLAEHERVNRRD